MSDVADAIVIRGARSIADGPRVWPDATDNGWRAAAKALALSAGAALALTLLFTAQQAAEQAADHAPIDWIATVPPNVLLWGVWALFAPLVLVLTRRYRLGLEHSVGRVVLWIAVGVTLSVAHAVTTALLVHGLGLGMLGLPSQPNEPLSTLLLTTTSVLFAPNMLTFGLIAGTLHAALYYRDLRARQLAQADLEARIARADLNALRMQLQPHFFFNTLHTVSSLMEHDVPAARRVLAALADLLRLSLDQMARHEVALREELAFVARYVEIQQARFRSRLTVHVEVPGSALDALVPTLILQPLVENAIRHGIEPHTRAGQVWIAASHDDHDLTLAVYDDGPAGPDGSPAVIGKGLGLSNMAARLQQMYGRAHRFQAARDRSGGFRVSVTIPFEVGASPAVAAASST